MNPEKKERNDEVIALWNSGLSYAEIGKKKGITREAAASIVYAAIERERYKKKFGELAELPPRVMNSVLRAGIKSKQELVELLKDGKFRAGKGMGRQAIYALEDFTGLQIIEASGRPFSTNRKEEYLKGLENGES